jgi:hypothetical protein
VQRGVAIFFSAATPPANFEFWVGDVEFVP